MRVTTGPVVLHVIQEKVLFFKISEVSLQVLLMTRELQSHVPHVMTLIILQMNINYGKFLMLHLMMKQLWFLKEDWENFV